VVINDSEILRNSLAGNSSCARLHMTLSLICYQHLIIVVIAVANQHNGVSYEAIALLLINLNASFFLS